MKIVYFLSVLCLAVVACKSDPTAPPEQPIAAPTGITVQNVDTSSIKIAWSRASGDTKTDTVVLLSQGMLVKAQAANKPDSTAVVHGLQPGLQYMISVHSANNASASVPWTIPGAPTSIVVQNIDTANIIVAWTRTKGDTQPDTVVVSWMGVPLRTATANAPDSVALVQGLHPGIAYTISVHSSNAISASVSWTIPIPQQHPFGSAGVGSTFFYRQFEIDSLGNRTYFDTLRYSIVATGITYQGKTHVTQFLLNVTSDPFFVNYEPNGDIELFESTGLTGGAWATIPLGSKGQVSTVVEDSIESGSHIVATDAYTFLGTEDVTVGGTTFKNTIKISNRYSRLVDGIDSNPRPASTIWFSSELGWFVKASSPSYYGYGQMQSGFEDDLVSYIVR